MRLYWEVGRATARRMATYRGATVAGLVPVGIFGNDLEQAVVRDLTIEEPAIEEIVRTIYRGGSVRT